MAGLCSLMQYAMRARAFVPGHVGAQSHSVSPMFRASNTCLLHPWLHALAHADQAHGSCGAGADVKGANQRQRNDRLNRALQNFLYGCLGAEGEAGAKPALAVLTELWRRQVWRDARTVNVIGAPRLAACCPWGTLPCPTPWQS